MEHSGKRLRILTRNEIQELYGLPNFTYEERIRYFSLNPLEQEEMEKYRYISPKVHFILQLGYFKAKKMFFIFNPKAIQKDRRYILRKYFPERASDKFLNIEISKPTRLAQQNCILKLCNYQVCTEEIKKLLQEKAYDLATIFTKPIYVFKELVNYLENHRIVVPGYSFMQDIVGKALTNETQATLDKLISAEDGLYRLTFLKKEPKDFSYKEITQEVLKRESLKPLYGLAQKFLSGAGISNENIKYYASLVAYYTVYKLKRMKCETAYIS